MAADTTRPLTANSEWDLANRDTLTNVRPRVQSG